MTNSEPRHKPRSVLSFPVVIRGAMHALVVLALFCRPAGADDAAIGKLLQAKGVEVTTTGGMVTAVTVQDGAKLTDEDFQQIARLTNLRTLSLNNCLNDKRLAQLTTLVELERLQTNQAQITDAGLGPLARLKNLRNVAFFHPGKSFSGAGLVHLEGLPNLERLTVAGSFAFNDDGLAAVARLTRLKEFRTWHAGGTNEGIKQLKGLKQLTSLHLGQRLTYRPPACPNGDTLAVVADLRSLESLQLDEARLTLAALLQLKQLPALRKLTLGGIDLPRADVERLQKELPRVKVQWTAPNEVYQKRIRALFGG
jgi:hypothetical protein